MSVGDKKDTVRIAEIKKQIQDLNFETDKIVDKYLGEGEGQFHKVGYWECKPLSPIGVCIYNKGLDPALDQCIYCGNPHERK